MTITSLQLRFRPSHNALGLEVAPRRGNTRLCRRDSIMQRALADDRHHVKAELLRHVPNVSPLQPPVANLHIEKHKVLVLPVVAATLLNLCAVTFALQAGVTTENLLHPGCQRQKSFIQPRHQLRRNLRRVRLAAKRHGAAI